jgi:predicted nucleotidyltransferase
MEDCRILSLLVLRTIQTVNVVCINMKIISQHIDQIVSLCQKNKVNSLFAFGSVTTNNFTDESDIDLVVDIKDNDPVTYTEKYYNLKFQLEEILKRKVDLLEMKAIRNRFLKNEIDRTKIQIYEERN